MFFLLFCPEFLYCALSRYHADFLHQLYNFLISCMDVTRFRCVVFVYFWFHFSLAFPQECLPISCCPLFLSSFPCSYQLSCDPSGSLCASSLLSLVSYYTALFLLSLSLCLAHSPKLSLASWTSARGCYGRTRHLFCQTSQLLPGSTT